MIEIPIRSMSRGEKRKLQSASFGDLAESFVVHEYGYQSDNSSESWFDAIHPNTGAKIEVKSTSTKIGKKYPGDGRFRLWENQHKSLVASDRSGVAWYAFVLLDADDAVLKIQRRKPSTVTRLVRARGGWNKAGHRDRSGRQHKLPWRAAING